MKLFATLFASLAVAASASAQSLDEVNALIAAGNYGEAQEMLDYLIATTKANNAGQLNLMAGECALNLQDTDAAANYFNKAAQRGVADAHLYLGRMAMADYDFARAKEQYGKYISLREKAGKETDEGRAALASANMATDMLDRVEQLEFIDAVDVPADRVLSALLISPEAGSVFTDEQGEPGFLSSDGRLKYTTATFTDEEGNEYTRIFEQTRLLSGDYDTPEPIMDEEQASYPFMMPDGCTFYFASAREGGLGGLDIYRSNRDSEDGSFMGAVNMGMPYNSPANDYMLAIDEYTGVGWLITDRGHDADGLATAYVFVPRDVRKNYDPDTEDIISYARIDNIEATRDPAKDYTTLLQAVDALRTPAVRKEARYSFTMPDGRVVTDFSDNKSLMAMKQYATNLDALNKAEQRLTDLRSRYGAGRTDLAQEILEAESTMESLARTVREQKQRLINILSSR